MIKKYIGISLIAASLVAAGCSSDDDDGPGVEAPVVTDPTQPGGSTTGMPVESMEVAPAPAFDGTTAQSDIAGTATAAAPEFTTLLAAITFAGDAFTALDGATPEAAVTVFAPTNAAFEASGINLTDGSVTPEDVAAVLNDHVIITGAYPKSALAAEDGNFLTTAGGTTLDISVAAEADQSSSEEAEEAIEEAADDIEEAVTGDEPVEAEAEAAAGGAVSVAGVELTADEILTTNGYIYSVETVLAGTPTTGGSETGGMPPVAGEGALALAIEADPELSDFAGLMRTAGFADLDGNFTVFAPTNEAILAAGGVEAVTALPNFTTLIQGHLSGNGAISGDDLATQAGTGSGTLAMTNGGMVALTLDADGGLLVDGVAVTGADIPADPHVVHKVDTVLMTAPGEGGAGGEAPPAEGGEEAATGDEEDAPADEATEQPEAVEEPAEEGVTDAAATEEATGDDTAPEAEATDDTAGDEGEAEEVEAEGDDLEPPAAPE